MKKIYMGNFTKIRLYENVSLLICVLSLISCVKFREYDLAEKRESILAVIEPKEILLPVEKKTETKNESFARNQMNLAPKEVRQISNAEKKPPISFKVGEKIVYDVKLLNMKNPFRFDNGSVTFEIDKGMLDQKDCYIFRGTAKGGRFGYKLIIASESYIEKNTFRPLLSTNVQSGSENRKKKLVFYEDKIEYVKLKHCKLGDTCQAAAHFTNENGAKVHCKKCKDKNHYTWRVRAVHNNEETAYDLLTALFIARTFDLEIGGKGQDIILVDGRDLWRMHIQAIDEGIIETEIGKFDTLSLKLTASPLNDHAKKQETFRGLFGLKGDIGLWVDKDSKIPIRIKGVYPLIFDIQIEIIIKSIEGNDTNRIGNIN